MKVAIPTVGNSWSDQVAEALETAPCCFIVDDRRASVQVANHPSPHASDPVQPLIALFEQHRVQLVIASDCSDTCAKRLQQAGIRLMTGVQGTVDLVYRRFYHGLLGAPCEYLVE